MSAAARQQPSPPERYPGLAERQRMACYALAGRSDELRRVSSSADGSYYLGLSLAIQGKTGEAIAQLRNAAAWSGPRKPVAGSKPATRASAPAPVAAGKSGFPLWAAALLGVAVLALGGFTLDEATLMNSPMLPYLAMVASLLEGRLIRREELLHTLRKSLRQRSFDRLPRREYVLRFLNQHPP